MSLTTVPDDQVVKTYFAETQLSEKAKIIAREVQLKIMADQIFIRLNAANKLTVERKQRRNEDVNNAFAIAYVINKIKLAIYLDKLIAKMIEQFREDANNTERYELYVAKLKRLSDPFPLPAQVILQQQQSGEEGKKQLIEQAQAELEKINVLQSQIEDKMMQYWGATTFDEGLKIQTQKIHDQMAEGINNLEFLNVIKGPEGAPVDLTGVDPEVLNKARDVFHHDVNDAFQEFLLTRNYSSPVVEDEFDVQIGADAPQAPDLGDLTETKPRINGRTQLGFDAEINLIKNARSGFGKIGEPLVKEYNVSVGEESKINKNSHIRLAAQFAKGIHKIIDPLQHQIENFQKDHHTLQKLGKLGNELVKQVNVLQNLHLTTQNVKPRRP